MGFNYLRHKPEGQDEYKVSLRGKEWVLCLKPPITSWAWHSACAFEAGTEQATHGGCRQVVVMRDGQLHNLET